MKTLVDILAVLGAAWILGVLILIGGFLLLRHLPDRPDPKRLREALADDDEDGGD